MALFSRLMIINKIQVSYHYHKVVASVSRSLSDAASTTDQANLW